MPDLAAVCAELGQIAAESRARIVKIERRNWLLRGVVLLVVGILIALFGLSDARGGDDKSNAR